MKNAHKGFTLVEIIVSLAIISIIAIGIIPAFAAQLKMTIDTKKITTQAFDEQGVVERKINDLISAIQNNTAIDSSITTTPGYTIFGKTGVSLYRLESQYTSNSNKKFLVFISQRLALMEKRKLLPDPVVSIDVSDDSADKVAKIETKSVLTGKFSAAADANFYVNVFNWYVSKEGDTDPTLPEDYIPIEFTGQTPSTLSDLSKYSNRYIVFSVTPVDIHGVRGNEKYSTNRVYVLGKEWREGLFAWVDRDDDLVYKANSDVPVAKTPLRWLLTEQLNLGDKIIDIVDGTGKTLDPSKGSLYVPMNISPPAFSAVGPVVVAEEGVLDWTADKSINIATDITVNNSTDIRLKANEGNIILYQYLALDSNLKAQYEDNMPVLATDGPELKTLFGNIKFETTKRGNVILQKYSSLLAGGNISITPFGNVSIYHSTGIQAKDSIVIDTSGGSAYSGNNRDITIKDSIFSLTGTGTGRAVTLKTTDALSIASTSFFGNSGDPINVNLTALGSGTITLSTVSFVNSNVSINKDASMDGGGWDTQSSLTVPDGKMLNCNSATGKIANNGQLNLGNTGAMSNASSFLNQPALVLSKGASDNTVVITTNNYSRNLGYASSNHNDTISTDDSYQYLGGGSSNLKYKVKTNFSRFDNSPNLMFDYDADNASIRIHATGSGNMYSAYTLTVADRYASGVSKSIVFTVSQKEGDSEPTVIVVGQDLPIYKVTFTDGSTTVASISVTGGTMIGTLPTAPYHSGKKFDCWWYAAGGTRIDSSYIVRDDMLVTANYVTNNNCEIKFYVYNYYPSGTGQLYNYQTSVIPKNQAIGSMLTSPDGYAITGWKDGNGNVVTAATLATGDSMEVYAQGGNRYSDITTGAYIYVTNSSSQNVAFQKINSTQLLARNTVNNNRGNNNITWSSYYTWSWSYVTGANEVAGNYYNTFTGNSWIVRTNSPSGLISKVNLDNLGTYFAEILQQSYTWWAAEKDSNNAYYVKTSNNSGYYANMDKDSDSMCRPYITVNPSQLYINSGFGTAASPYTLKK